MTFKRLTERNALAFPVEQSAGVCFSMNLHPINLELVKFL